MPNLSDLLQALKYAKWNREGFTVGGSEFTPEQTATLLGELYEILSIPVVAEYRARYGEEAEHA